MDFVFLFVHSSVDLLVGFKVTRDLFPFAIELLLNNEKLLLGSVLTEAKFEIYQNLVIKVCTPLSYLDEFSHFAVIAIHFWDFSLIPPTLSYGVFVMIISNEYEEIG